MGKHSGTVLRRQWGFPCTQLAVFSGGKPVRDHVIKRTLMTHFWVGKMVIVTANSRVMEEEHTDELEMRGEKIQTTLEQLQRFWISTGKINTKRFAHFVFQWRWWENTKISHKRSIRLWSGDREAEVYDPCIKPLNPPSCPVWNKLIY